ncbi:hypothetical protein [Pseudogracilibacillus sp. SO30301A]|uniref:hypothetical protein n=1 Tax=Pseudogracilibacillus sp. SO30301A TaxID=3098291 RepID=UPI00300DD3E7
MDSSRMVPFILMWGIPIFIVMRAYLKLDTKDRNSAKKDFKTPNFIFTIGFLIIGLFLAQIGSIFSITIVNLIGIILLAVGGIVAGIDMWKTSKGKSIWVLLFTIIMIYVSYG